MSRKSDGLALAPSEIAAAFADSGWAKQFPPVLTVEQAAELLQVPKATIYDWSSRKLLGGCARRVGKHLRIFRDRLMETIFNRGILNDA